MGKQQKFVVAATELVGGEFFIHQGDALGPIVAGPFSRTIHGHLMAEMVARDLERGKGVTS